MILITGASGTVGREVVKALGGRSARVQEGKMAVVTPTVKQLKGSDPTSFEQFAREHTDTLR